MILSVGCYGSAHCGIKDACRPALSLNGYGLSTWVNCPFASLMAEYPDGPLFRGPRGGKPFTRNGIRCRFKRLRQKLPHLKGLIAYADRHSFATDALVNGVGIAQVAELLGHTNTEMVMRHYSHIAGKIDHMRQAAMRAACAG